MGHRKKQVKILMDFKQEVSSALYGYSYDVDYSTRFNRIENAMHDCSRALQDLEEAKDGLETR